MTSCTVLYMKYMANKGYSMVRKTIDIVICKSYDADLDQRGLVRVKFTRKFACEGITSSTSRAESKRSGHMSKKHQCRAELVMDGNL